MIMMIWDRWAEDSHAAQWRTKDAPEMLVRWCRGTHVDARDSSILSGIWKRADNVVQMLWSRRGSPEQLHWSDVALRGSSVCMQHMVCSAKQTRLRMNSATVCCYLHTCCVRKCKVLLFCVRRNLFMFGTDACIDISIVALFFKTYFLMCIYTNI